MTNEEKLEVVSEEVNKLSEKLHGMSGDMAEYMSLMLNVGHCFLAGVIETTAKECEKPLEDVVAFICDAVRKNIEQEFLSGEMNNNDR